MKKKVLVMLLAALLVSATASAGVIFTEDFEDPQVVGYDKAPPAPDGWRVPQNNTWAGPAGGYGCNEQGFYNDGAGNQSWSFKYTNSGLTTVRGEIGVLEANVDYTLKVDVGMDVHKNDGLPYKFELVTFNESEVIDGIQRTSVIAGMDPYISAKLATATGEATADGLWTTITLTLSAADIAENFAGAVGDDLAIRLIGATTSANYDNVELSATAVPEPATLALLGLGSLLLRRKR